MENISTTIILQCKDGKIKLEKKVLTEAMKKMQVELRTSVKSAIKYLV